MGVRARWPVGESSAVPPSALAMLCDVDSYVVVYDEGESQPEHAEGVPRAGLVQGHADQCKKMMDMERFLNQCIDMRTCSCSCLWP